MRFYQARHFRVSEVDGGADLQLLGSIDFIPAPNRRVALQRARQTFMAVQNEVVSVREASRPWPELALKSVTVDDAA